VISNGIKVLLVYVNSPMDNLIPIGISLLSSFLKNSGHEVKLFDTTFYKTTIETGDDVRVKTLQVKYTNLSKLGINFKNSNLIEDFRILIEEYKPDLIGLSCVEPTIQLALFLLNSIKDKKIPKILGGIGVMFLADEIIHEDSVDMVCIGEGEYAITELANAIRDNIDYSNIKNLWIKKDDIIKKNDINQLVDINNLPFQDWSIYQKERFFKPMGGKIRVTGAFELVRGCPRMCSYCCNYGINKFYKKKYVRQKNIDRIIDEIQYMKDKYSIEYVYFYAENFLLTIKDDDFNKFIASYEKIKMPFWIETEPESITENRLSKLKMIGCEGISVGIEHGNEKFRKKILNRYITNEKLIKAFTIAKKYGIRISANNIIGFPTETRELIFETIELNRKLNADNIIVNLFVPYRGTKLRELSIKKGYLNKNDRGWDYRFSAALDQPQLKKEELLGLHRTFVLYTTLPKKKWDLIKMAEKFDENGNRIHHKLSMEYLSLK